MVNRASIATRKRNNVDVEQEWRRREEGTDFMLSGG
jgi:hypothetical protein